MVARPSWRRAEAAQRVGEVRKVAEGLDAGRHRSENSMRWMVPEQRRESARKAARARWAGKKKGQT